jgi:hypothetical protein
LEPVEPILQRDSEAIGLIERAKVDLPTGFNAQRAICLFFSFDLAGSTDFKTKIDGWPDVILGFYRATERAALDNVKRLKLWKYVGDEVLLYKTVTCREDLENSIKGAFASMAIIKTKLEQTYESVRIHGLTIKGTVWMAPVSTKADDVEADLYFDLQTPITFGGGENVNERLPRMDFLGPNIDIGFRISKFAERDQLVVSANIAHYLWEIQSDIAQYLKIVSFEKLKGVMNEAYYPIIWFRKKWDIEDLKHEFYYDAQFSSTIIAKILNGEIGGQSHFKLFYSKISALAKRDPRRYAHLVEAEVVDLLLDVKDKVDFEMVKENRLAEVHCAAVCLNPEGKVLIAKRSGSKTYSPGYIELGCAQLSLGQNFSDCLKNAYLRDFGLAINISNEVPVGVYSIEKELGNTQGLFFMASSIGEATCLPERHEWVRWVDSKELQAICLSEHVFPDIVSVVKLCFALNKRGRVKKKQSDKEVLPSQ